MPSPEPTVVADIVLTQQPNGRWRARGWTIAVRNIRVPQAAVALVVEKLRAANACQRTETVYVGPGKNYGCAGLYQVRLFREPARPGMAEAPRSVSGQPKGAA